MTPSRACMILAGVIEDAQAILLHGDGMSDEARAVYQGARGLWSGRAPRWWAETDTRTTLPAYDAASVLEIHARWMEVER